MTADATNTDLLRDALDRLARQEQRTQALEAILTHTAPGRPPATRPLTETPSPSAHDTPTVFLWPPKRVKPPDAGSDAPAIQPATPPPPDPHAVLASLEDVIWSTSPTGEAVYFLGGGVSRTFGRAATDFLARPRLWLDTIPGDDRVAFRTALLRLPATDLFTLEHRVATPSGSTRWVVSRARLVRGPDGQPARVDGITTDITARSRTERTGLTILEAIGPATGSAFLDRVVQQFATAFDARAAVIAVPDPVEPNVARTVAAWLDGRPADGFAFSAHGGFVRDVLAGGSQFVPSAARDRFPADEFLNRLRAETVAAVPLVDSAGLLLGFVAVADDRAVRADTPDARAVLRALAPRVAAELTRPEAAPPVQPDPAMADERRGATRLELAGRLVVGVAHDFNNLLTIITGNAELLYDRLPADEPLRESADAIVSTGTTAAQIARQLLAFAKPSAAAISCPLDPNRAVSGIERMLRRLADRVKVEVLLAPGVPSIRVDPGQFDQVLLNLVANARDAIPETGAITVRTARATVSTDRPGWPAECPPGEYVAVTVTDTGCGMTAEVQARAFTRFFTTKGANGTGIGLATVRDIVRGAGGHVEVESSPEWGTSVRVFWPAVGRVVESPPVLRMLDS